MCKSCLFFLLCTMRWFTPWSPCRRCTRRGLRVRRASSVWSCRPVSWWPRPARRGNAPRGSWSDAGRSWPKQPRASQATTGLPSSRARGQPWARSSRCPTRQRRVASRPGAQCGHLACSSRPWTSRHAHALPWTHAWSTRWSLVGRYHRGRRRSPSIGRCSWPLAPSWSDCWSPARCRHGNSDGSCLRTFSAFGLFEQSLLMQNKMFRFFLSKSWELFNLLLLAKDTAIYTCERYLLNYSLHLGYILFLLGWL